ncbi:hypothetical protein AcW1_005185 [Taiwanofungus camphoratus]|nr:hypothetical protein AcW1_005185 [Antrodia cinnamomea]
MPCLVSRNIRVAPPPHVSTPPASQATRTKCFFASAVTPPLHARDNIVRLIVAAPATVTPLP